MDLNRPYRNRSLEIKRLRSLQTQAALEKMRAARAAIRSPRQQVQRAMAGEHSGVIGDVFFGWLKTARRVHQEALGRLLDVLLRSRSRLVEDRRFARPLCEVACRLGVAVRDVESWRVTSHNADRQMASLLRHLFAVYPMPEWFDSAWTFQTDAGSHWRDWYIQIGQGAALRTMCDLPFPLTKRMAHCAMQAPRTLDVGQALRWGQVCGLGGSVRLADAVVATEIDTIPERQDFWTTVVHFLVNNPMLDPRQVGPIIDYIRNRRFVAQREFDREGWHEAIPEPNFSMKGRTVESLLRQVHAWHADLTRVPRGFQNVCWPSCGISGMRRVEGVGDNERLFAVTELCGSGELLIEGRAMGHCVASYAHSCAAGRSAIFSMQNFTSGIAERMVTIEVVPLRREIVQIQGRHNRLPTNLEKRLIRVWMVQARLKAAGHCKL
jgi:hypothetical protein